MMKNCLMVQLNISVLQFTVVSHIFRNRFILHAFWTKSVISYDADFKNKKTTDDRLTNPNSMITEVNDKYDN